MSDDKDLYNSDSDDGWSDDDWDSGDDLNSNKDNKKVHSTGHAKSR